MNFSRVLLFTAVVCIAFGVISVYTRPLATYTTYEGNGSATTTALAVCPSVWDRWTDHLPPAPIPEPTSVLNEIGQTKAELKASACGASIVGHEHISETWGAAALVALIMAGVVWFKLED